MSTPPLPSPRLPRDRYLDLPEIDVWGAALVEAHPGLLRREIIGHSGEGRPIWLYTLGRLDGADPIFRILSRGCGVDAGRCDGR